MNNCLSIKSLRVMTRLSLMLGVIFCSSLVVCNAEIIDIGVANSTVAPDLSSNAPSPDLFTGTMSYTIPIKVPPGRNGLTPEVALSYRSSNGNGWIGMGWELEMGSIQRSTRWGVDYSKEDDQHYFQLRKGGAITDLIFSSTDSFYRAKIDDDYNRIKKLTAADGQIYWELTNKVGTRFIFGQSTRSRQYDRGDENHLPNPNLIFKWCLDQVIDTNGNYMTLTYSEYQGQIYLESISYTGNLSQGLIPTNHIRFYIEPRTDVRDSYTTNFAVKTQFRLRTIDVISNYGLENSSRIRSYDLRYDPGAAGSGPVTGRSLLIAVTGYGSDADISWPGRIVGGTSLPPIKFKYNLFNFGGSVPENGWELSSWTGPGLSVVTGLRAYYINYELFFEQFTGSPQIQIQCIPGDFNGDARTDIACYNDGSWEMGVSSGVGQWVSGWQGPAISTSVYGYRISNQCLAGDFNGDASTEAACYPGSGSTWRIGSITETTNWTGPSLCTGSKCVTMAGYSCLTGDFDGDGKVDITCPDGDSGLHMALSTLMTTDGWQTTTWRGLTLPTPVILSSGNIRGAFPEWCITGNFNDDGKVDLACIENDANGGVMWKLAISTGTEWVTNNWSGPEMLPNVPIRGQCVAGDFNGDGITDVACYNGKADADGVKKWGVALSTGSGWKRTTWANDLEPVQDVPLASQCLTGDFNGDGMTDIACLENYGLNSGDTWNVRISGGEIFQYSIRNWHGLTPKPNEPLGSQCTTGDFNGDGRTDVACYPGSGSAWNVALSVANENAFPTDLLKSITNGYGSGVSIIYQLSSPYGNHRRVNVVSSITTCDNNDPENDLYWFVCDGNTARTDYWYSGQSYYGAERDFRGFHYAKVTGPPGPNGEQKITETWFHQGNETDVLAEHIDWSQYLNLISRP